MTLELTFYDIVPVIESHIPTEKNDFAPSDLKTETGLSHRLCVLEVITTTIPDEYVHMV